MIYIVCDRCGNGVAVDQTPTVFRCEFCRSQAAWIFDDPAKARQHSLDIGSKLTARILALEPKP